jgi:hypothetical protein
LGRSEWRPLQPVSVSPAHAHAFAVAPAHAIAHADAAAIAFAHAIALADANASANAHAYAYAIANAFNPRSPEMLTITTALEFTTPYVAHPYWPEMYQVIEITKKSGMNRAKSDANRRKSLEEYLRQHDMTLADYERLEAASKRPFHMDGGEIIIPPDNILSFLVAANDEARAAFRACPPDQVRSKILATPFVTGKTAPDGVWTRFATVSLGTGAKASNQRGLRENAYIEGFTARGALTIDEQTVDPPSLRNLIEWGGQFVGIGASRKMGKGRFKIAAWAIAGGTADVVPVKTKARAA